MELQRKIDSIEAQYKKKLRDRIPFDRVIDVLFEGLEATKVINIRGTGGVESPDWDSRIRCAQLRIQLGGECDDDQQSESIIDKRQINIIVNRRESDNV